MMVMFSELLWELNPAVKSTKMHFAILKGLTKLQFNESLLVLPFNLHRKPNNVISVKRTLRPFCT